MPLNESSPDDKVSTGISGAGVGTGSSTESLPKSPWATGAGCSVTNEAGAGGVDLKSMDGISCGSGANTAAGSGVGSNLAGATDMPLRVLRLGDMTSREVSAEIFSSALAIWLGLLAICKLAVSC